jgi:hypothetical protein
MSFFQYALETIRRQAPINRGTGRHVVIIVKSALRVCPDLRGTLMPFVKGHTEKKTSPCSRYTLPIMINFKSTHQGRVLNV